MTAQEALRAACRDAERRGLLSSWYEDNGRIRVIPRSGPPQILRSMRDLDLIVMAARRRMVPR